MSVAPLLRLGFSVSNNDRRFMEEKVANHATNHLEVEDDLG